MSWTTHLYRPEELAGLLADAGLVVVTELRLLMEAPIRHPQVLFAAQRPA